MLPTGERCVTTARKRFSISDLASEFDVTTRTIRFYEEKGLLKPARNGQSRIYGAADRVKLKLILRGRHLGLSLEESKDVIEMYDPRHGNVRQLSTLIDKIREKRGQLERQLQDLEAMMADLRGAEERCLAALADVGHPRRGENSHSHRPPKPAKARAVIEIERRMG